MSVFLPLFPLNIVAFPGEVLNLHIFEPRYKDLVNDCLENKSNFGIPAFVDNKIDFGTEVEITELVKKYEDGRMDVRTMGKRIFEVIDFQNPYKEKKYAGGEVDIFNTEEDTYLETSFELIELLDEFCREIEVDTDLFSPPINSFGIAHHIGLSIIQKHALIQLKTEGERQAFIFDHLSNLVPMLHEVEQTKERIKMNGHFRHFDPLNF